MKSRIALYQLVSFSSLRTIRLLFTPECKLCGVRTNEQGMTAMVSSLVLLLLRIIDGERPSAYPPI